MHSRRESWSGMSAEMPTKARTQIRPFEKEWRSSVKRGTIMCGGEVEDSERKEDGGASARGSAPEPGTPRDCESDTKDEELTGGRGESARYRNLESSKENEEDEGVPSPEACCLNMPADPAGRNLPGGLWRLNAEEWAFPAPAPNSFLEAKGNL